MDEHIWKVWAWPASTPRWGYDAICSCGLELSGRWGDLQAQMSMHLSDARADAEQAEAEAAHG